MRERKLEGKDREEEGRERNKIERRMKRKTEEGKKDLKLER